jgi:hypothetical protein
MLTTVKSSDPLVTEKRSLTHPKVRSRSLDSQHALLGAHDPSKLSPHQEPQDVTAVCFPPAVACLLYAVTVSLLPAYSQHFCRQLAERRYAIPLVQ